MDAAAVATRNTTAFLWFRVLFNARFYYPVYAILFLDLGLSLEQFAVLGTIWAASIVLFEVPSGALADRLGRKHLVVFSSWMMIVEMLLLCLVPVGGGSLTFWVFAANRIVSGLAEAACSGADEALVYDALSPDGRDAAWTRVLARMMFWQSFAVMITGLIGAATYSHEFMNTLPGLGWLSKEQCLRIPLWLNLGMAVATLIVSFRFIDTHPRSAERSTLAELTRASFSQMAGAARWILRSPATMVLILTGLLYDSFTRLFYSVGSNYYRLLGIPEAANGFILAGSSLIGIGTAVLVEKLVGKLKPSQNMGLVAGSILIGLAGTALQVKAGFGVIGVMFAIPFWLALRSLHYFLSQYLNKVTDSSQRATVLSFKGLSMTLAYGVVMQFYGFQTAWLRHRDETALAALNKEEADLHLLGEAMPWWPWIFGVLALLLVAFVRLKYRSGLTTLIASKPATHP